MKKILASLLISAFLSPVAFAAPKAGPAAARSSVVKKKISPQKKLNHAQISAALKRVRAKVAAREKSPKAGAKVLNFFLSPQSPKQNERVVVFAQLATQFEGMNAFVEASFDSNPVVLEKSAPDLWAYEAGSFERIGSHSFTAHLFVEDSEAANDIRAAISALDILIADLNDQIELEEDEGEKALLIAQRDLRLGEKQELVDNLTALKQALGSQTISFTVAENPSSPGVPSISSVSPKSGPVEGGTPVVIEGANFVPGMTGTLGGVAIEPYFYDSTKVSFITPSFGAAEGPKALELAIPSGPNAIRQNAFYAVADLPANSKPVAVAGPSQVVEFGASVTVDGSASYDIDGNVLEYAWFPISVPAGSAIPVNEFYSGDSSFLFTPDRPGQYIWQLEIVEIGTTPELSSEPSLTVVTVTPPPNSAPVATAGALPPMAFGLTHTAQVDFTDSDHGQSHLYMITKPSAFGTASISSSGLLTFTSGNAAGSDTIEVAVIDNGSPALFDTVTVPVTVVNSVVTVEDLSYMVHSRGGFITVELGADVLESSGGDITSVEWSFGDGTSAPSFYLEPNEGWVIHDYQSAGTYTAQVTVTDEYGATATESLVFNPGTSAMPVAHLTSDVISGSVPLTVDFDASGSTDDLAITSYRYRWGDGTPDESSVDGLKSHTFDDPGEYRVRLVLLDADGNRTVSHMDIFAGVTPPAEGSRPVPVMKVASREVAVSTPHAFSGADSFDPNPSGSIAAYRWNFGDFITCTGFTPGCDDTGSTTNHTYPAAETFYATLEVEGSAGAVRNTGVEVMAVNSGHAPRALAGAEYIEGVAPYTLQVDGSNSFDYDGTVESYLWSFGDPGCTSGCESPAATGSYTYTDPGTYWVNLSVTDDDGNVHSQGFTLEVYPDELSKKQDAQKRKKGAAERGDLKLRHTLGQICYKKGASACHGLAEMFRREGRLSTADGYSEKACSLGHGPACSTGAKKGKK